MAREPLKNSITMVAVTKAARPNAIIAVACRMPPAASATIVNTPDDGGNHEGAPQAVEGTLAPGDQRANAGQEQQEEPDGNVDADVIGSVDGFLFAGERFHHDREQRAPQHGKAARQQDQVVKQEAGFARDHAFQFRLAAQIGQVAQNGVSGQHHTAQ